MSWGAVAGAAIGVVGGMMSSKSASKDAKKSAQADKAALDFEKQRYNDWKAVYGDIQSNLAEFYGGLDSKYFEVSGIEALEQEKTLALENINTVLAQRGIDMSGMAGQAYVDLEMETAKERANIRKNAPLLAKEQQLSFLQVGLGQDPSSSMSQTLANQANNAADRADTSARSSAAATQAALTGVGNALSDYLEKDD